MPDLVLNELSFRNWEDPQAQESYPCANKHQARKLMDIFVQTLIDAGRYPSIPRQIRMREGDLDCDLAPGYSIPQWRNDPEVDRDARLLLRQRAAVLYYLPNTPQAVVDRSENVEVRFNGHAGYGICAAFLLDGIALSLPSHQIWACDALSIEVHEITSVGELREFRRALPHVSQSDHLLRHTSQDFEAPIQNGNDLLRQAVIRFPLVEIGVDAYAHLADLTGNEKYFSWVIRCFREANEEMQSWQAGPFPHRHLPGPATGESGPVRSSPRLMALRRFRLPSGEEHQFEYHMKNLPEKIRIYYEADTVRRRVIIGAMTGHLETALY